MNRLSDDKVPVKYVLYSHCGKQEKQRLGTMGSIRQKISDGTVEDVEDKDSEPDVPDPTPLSPSQMLRSEAFYPNAVLSPGRYYYSDHDRVSY